MRLERMHGLRWFRASSSGHRLGTIITVTMGLTLRAAALAQGLPPPPPPTAVAPAAAAGEERFSQEDLDRLLAPIALYPDELLAQVLMASTYPLEVVEAERWVRANPGLSGDALQSALQSQDWDPSVKGLVAVPQVLAMMDEQLGWTEALGDAFLAQEQDAMDTVQRLRARAQAAGSLASTPQQSVTSEGGIISIEPDNPEVVYVPVYNPEMVYGPWWWPVEPYYWYPPDYVADGPILYFGVGFFVGSAIWGNFDWHHRGLIINARNFDRFNRTHISNVNWAHNPEHRRGVPYRNPATQRRYETALPGADARREFRGYGEPRAPFGEAPSAPGVGERPPRVTPRVPAQPPITEPAAAPRFAAPRAQPSVPTPPAFESFGPGNAARAYSNRGAQSRAIERGGGAGQGGGGGAGHGGGLRGR